MGKFIAKITKIMLTCIIIIVMTFLTKPRNEKHMILDYYQFDSICKQEQIPRNLIQWDKQYYYDNDKNIKIKLILKKNNFKIYQLQLINKDSFDIIIKEP